MYLICVKGTKMDYRPIPELEEYIRLNYVEIKPAPAAARGFFGAAFGGGKARASKAKDDEPDFLYEEKMCMSVCASKAAFDEKHESKPGKPALEENYESGFEEPAFEEEHESRLEERMKHLSDTFSEYLLYIIEEKQMANAEVYKRALVDKKTFSKIKNNADYHPQKLTALCLCVGASLNLDETKDLLARAGYALSPCDKTDVIFSYFIENGIFDMIGIDIQLEGHGLPCIIA